MQQVHKLLIFPIQYWGAVWESDYFCLIRVGVPGCTFPIIYSATIMILLWMFSFLRLLNAKCIKNKQKIIIIIIS